MTAPLRQNTDRGENIVAISVSELRDLMISGDEAALLDVREEYDYAQGHILLATLLPLSRLELRIAALVPRAATRIIVTDGGDGALAQPAANRLQTLGYGDVSILEGGIAEWKANGYPLFTTTHVLAKTFGGIVERETQTPHISPEDLKDRIDSGDDIAVFDSRTFAEFQAGSVPGASSCPLAELVYRVPAAVRSPDTLVVINCASRTRGILGAQSLLNLGLPNKVVVLENGLMAWSLAGGNVVQGAERVAAKPDDDHSAESRAAAKQIAERFTIPLIGRDTLETFQRDRNRSLYIFDVRSPDEYERGHLPDARSAPGGQLIMTVTQFIATQRARVVLVDGGDLVRAVTTASWLAQIARHEVAVLSDIINPEDLVAGPEPAATLGLPNLIHRIGVTEANRLLKADSAAIIDVDTSLVYQESHLPGARFAIRARLPHGLETIDAGKTLIVTSIDGQLAALTAADLAESGHRVLALDGGTAAWRAAGLPVESGPRKQLHPFEDLWPSPMRATENKYRAFDDYLTWEISLINQIDKEATVHFQLTPVQ